MEKHTYTKTRYMEKYACTLANTHTHRHMEKYTHKCTYTHKDKHTLIHSQPKICMHTHTHTHTHTHIVQKFNTFCVVLADFTRVSPDTYRQAQRHHDKPTITHSH